MLESYTLGSIECSSLILYTVFIYCLGGLLCQGVTEITGESASGKTQFCMQLALSSQLVKRNGKTCSESYTTFYLFSYHQAGFHV